MNRSFFTLLFAGIATFTVAFIAPSGVLADNEADGGVSVMRDNSPGSFLIFPKFDIRGERETQIRIVNNHGWKDREVKLNFVCPGVQPVVDAFCPVMNNLIELTPHETAVIDVRDQNPPCEQGYVVAWAYKHGKAYGFDYLTGSYHLFDGRRHEAENAIAVQTLREGSFLGDDGTLRFGKAEGDYRAIGDDLFTDFRATAAEPDRGSRLVLLDLNIEAGQANAPATVAFNFWSASEELFSSALQFICWTEVALEDIDLNFFEENLGTEHGSMKIDPDRTCPVAGGCSSDDQYHYPALVGTIEEYGDGTRATRNLYHDGSEDGIKAYYRPSGAGV